jgi:predicted acyl esterase
MRRLLIFSAILFSAWLVLTAALGVVAAEMALHPGRRALAAQEADVAQSIAARNRAILAAVSIPAADGVILRAWHLHPGHGNGSTVLLLHGHTDNRAGMLGFADMFLRHGYSVLLPDARAHGVSGGDMATYGIRERDDVRLWFN